MDEWAQIYCVHFAIIILVAWKYLVLFLEIRSFQHSLTTLL